SGAIGAGKTVTFSGSGGVLLLAAPTTFAGTVAGLSLASQEIDLAGFAYGSGETVSWTEAVSNTSGTLTVTDGALVANINLLGSYVTSNFALSDDGTGGTIVVDPPATPPTAELTAQDSAPGNTLDMRGVEFELTSLAERVRAEWPGAAFNPQVAAFAQLM